MHKVSSRISVLISVCHSDDSGFFNRALKSVWNHQYSKPDELVIVLDGPLKPDLNELMRDWTASLGNKIKVVALEKNSGLAAALNRGLEHCRGKWVARMDADDISFPERFQTQLSFLEMHPEVDILGSAAIEINNKGTIGSIRERPLSHETIMDCLWASPIIHSSVIFRRDKIINLGGYDASLRRRQDYELWFRAAEAGLIFANIQKPLLWYRFDDRTHHKQPPDIALQQALIGFRGCRRLKLAWWKAFGCFIPFFRSLLPYRVQHVFYRLLTPLDPRREKC